MANVLSALGKLISKIFSTIFKVLKELLGKYFLIILLIVAIYFAPLIAGYLASVGAPTFLVSAFETLALATPYVVSAVDTVWAGVSSFGSKAWNAFKTAELGIQAAVVLGVSALIAPEETGNLVSEVVDAAGEVVGTVVSGTGAGNLLTYAMWGVLGYFGYKMLSGEKRGTS